MARRFRKHRKQVASAPGTLVYTGRYRDQPVSISIMDYDVAEVRESVAAGVEECLPHRDTDTVSWINVNGLHDVELLGKLGDHFGLHPLVQEDIVNTGQRPKLEDHGDYLYLVCRMITWDEQRQEAESEQVSLVLGPNFVLSFQEREGDVFGPVRERLRAGKGRIRKAGADYLAYALLDAVVDHYFVVLEMFGDLIEDVETRLLETPAPDLLQRIHALKREAIQLRRSVWPLREVVAQIGRQESSLVQDGTRIFFRDVHDHTVQVADAVESSRDMISGLQDLYLSSLSNRMNEVMKVLTIIATIFVPLTFAAGIYGMNFTHMPELGWKWSYPLFWIVILAIGGQMVLFFRRRGWL